MKPIKLFCLFLLLTFIIEGCSKKPTKLLHQAAVDGDIEQVKLHISIGTDTNAKDKDGCTLLHLAAGYGYKDVVELLIANGANVNTKDEKDRAPLHLAARNGHKDVAEFLIAKGSDINAKAMEDLIIEAAPKIIQEFPQVRFLIVGDCFRPEDKKYRIRLIELANSLCLQNYIIFTGHLDNVLEVISIFDISVVPSLSEPFGRVIIEAMGLEIPVVATNVGGIPEIIEDGISGILVPPRDENALATAILDLLEKPKKRKRIGQEGRKRFLKEFTMQKTIGRIERLYKDILKPNDH